MCRQLDAMRIPEKAFAPGEDSPGRDLSGCSPGAGRNFGSGVIQAGGTVDAGAGVQSAVYDPSRDPTRNMQVADQAPDTVSVAVRDSPAGHRRAAMPARQSPATVSSSRARRR